MDASTVLLDTAAELLSAERYQAALTLLESCEPSPLVLWRQAQAWFGRGYPMRAILLLKMVDVTQVDADVKHEVRLDLATTYNRIGRWRDALVVLGVNREAVVQSGNTRLGLLYQLAIDVAHLRNGKHEALLTHWPAIEPQLRALGLTRERVVGAVYFADAHLSRGDWRKSIELIEDTMHEARQHGFTRTLAWLHYRKIVARYSAESVIDETDLRALEVAAADSDAMDVQTDAIYARGLYLWPTGDWPVANHAFQKAFDRYSELGNLLEADATAISLARIAFDQGAYATALKWITPVTLRQEHVNGSPWVMGWASLMEGWIHVTLGNTGMAEVCLKAGWAHFIRVGQVDPAMFCALQLVMLPSLTQVDRQRWLQRIAELDGNSYNSVYRIMKERVQGEYLLANNDAVAARPYLERVLIESQLAGILPEWARAAAAVIECDWALSTTAAEWVALDAQAERYLTAVEAFPEIQVRIAFVRAEIAHARGDLTLALAHLQTASQHIRRMRALAGDPALSGAIASAFGSIYRRGTAIAVSAGNLALAVEFVEGWRAQQLAQHTALHATRFVDRARKSNALAPLPDDATGAALVEHRRTLQSALNAVWFGTPARQTELPQQTYAEFDVHAMAQSALEGGRPFELLDVAALRAAFNRRFGAAWTAVQIEPAGATSTALEWWLMVLTPETLTVELIRPAHALDRLSVQWLTQTDLSWRTVMLTEQSKGPLYQRVSALLKVDQWLQNAATPDHTLIFAGCEPCVHLPLAALPLANGQRLGERAVLRHGPSWNVAAHLCARRERIRPEAMRTLLVAPVTFGERHPMLPASAREVAALHNLWPASDTLIGADATARALNEMNQQGALLNYDLLHFATHVRFDPAWSRVSGIALHDGDLWLQTLLDWRLDAEVVSVSGCEAGRNQSVGGEEWLGIETALIAAGARNVLSPQWHVRDAVTAKFTAEVMSTYLKTGDLGLALTRTQRAFSRTHSLLDWAAWSVFGMQ